MTAPGPAEAVRQARAWPVGLRVRNGSEAAPADRIDEMALSGDTTNLLEIGGSISNTPTSGAQLAD
jgi:hypothetical protein